MDNDRSAQDTAQKGTFRRLLALAELLLMTAAVVFDLLIPSLLIVLFGVAFVLIRKEKMPVASPPKSLGAARFVLLMLGWAVLWTVVQYCLILPVQNHLFKGARDVDSFASVQGNLPNLLTFLLASWTLGALGEELAFRGFFQNRIISLFHNHAFGTAAAVAFTAVLFGAIHTEQGIVGMIVTAADGVFFSLIRYRYKSVWASVLVHGFLNTIGLIAFYFAGPLYGLW